MNILKILGLALLFLVVPIGLNFIIRLPVLEAGQIIGEPKDWLMFWGAYISSVATSIMVYLTYRIIKQNDEARKGEIAMRVVRIGASYCLEIINVGNSSIYDICLKINREFLEKLNNPLNRYNLKKLEASPIVLKPNEIAVLRIANCLKGTYTGFNPDTNNWDKIKVDDDYINEIKNSPISVLGVYKTINQQFAINKQFKISDFILEFANQRTVFDDELPEIKDHLSEIKDELGKICDLAKEQWKKVN